MNIVRPGQKTFRILRCRRGKFRHLIEIRTYQNRRSIDLECAGRAKRRRRFGSMLMAAPHKVCWPHAPFHELSGRGTYILTAGTYKKQQYFRTIDRLRVLHRGLLFVAQDFGWRLEAWAVFSNHYHFVGHSPAEGAENLSEMLGFLHEKTAKWINKLDGAAGRKIWYNFWE